MSGLKISSTLGHGTGPQGQSREGVVDIEDEKSVTRWAEALHVDPEELLQLVQEYGPIVRDIRQGLSKREAA